jgi:hypothetical protein
VVGRREHIDHEDIVSDVHSTLQILVKLTCDGKVIFDRSVCPVHQKVMARRKVPVSYGLPSINEYCLEHFPNFREVASGGCVDIGEEKLTDLYICPSCVAAYRAYIQNLRTEMKQEKELAGSADKTD